MMFHTLAKHDTRHARMAIFCGKLWMDLVCLAPFCPAESFGISASSSREVAGLGHPWATVLEGGTSCDPQPLPWFGSPPFWELSKGKREDSIVLRRSLQKLGVWPWVKSNSHLPTKIVS